MSGEGQRGYLKSLNLQGWEFQAEPTVHGAEEKRVAVVQ